MAEAVGICCCCTGTIALGLLIGGIITMNSSQDSVSALISQYNAAVNDWTSSGRSRFASMGALTAGYTVAGINVAYETTLNINIDSYYNHPLLTNDRGALTYQPYVLSSVITQPTTTYIQLAQDIGAMVNITIASNSTQNGTFVQTAIPFVYKFEYDVNADPCPDIMGYKTCSRGTEINGNCVGTLLPTQPRVNGQLPIPHVCIVINENYEFEGYCSQPRYKDCGLPERRTRISPQIDGSRLPPFNYETASPLTAQYGFRQMRITVLSSKDPWLAAAALTQDTFDLDQDPEVFEGGRNLAIVGGVFLGLVVCTLSPFIVAGLAQCCLAVVMRFRDCCAAAIEVVSSVVCLPCICVSACCECCKQRRRSPKPRRPNQQLAGSATRSAPKRVSVGSAVTEVSQRSDAIESKQASAPALLVVDSQASMSLQNAPNLVRHSAAATGLESVSVVVEELPQAPHRSDSPTHSSDAAIASVTTDDRNPPIEEDQGDVRGAQVTQAEARELTSEDPMGPDDLS